MKRILALLMVLILSACASAPNESKTITEGGGEKLIVSATIPPLVDIVQRVGGDMLEVNGVLPPGASPHTYDFSPSDIKKIADSQLLFAIGLGVDDWSYDLLEASSEDIELVLLNESVDLLKFEEEHDEHEEELHEEELHEEELHEEEHDEHEEELHEEHDHEHSSEFDPHYWLDPMNAKLMAEEIKETLVKYDPENAEQYALNLEAFSADLDKVDTEIKEIFAGMENEPKLLVFHDAWNYFAQHYDLEIVGAFALSPGKEASAQHLEQIYTLIETYDLPAIFAEPQLASGVLQSIVEDFDLKVFTLDPLGGIDNDEDLPRKTYSDLLLYNAKTIQKAFE